MSAPVGDFSLTSEEVMRGGLSVRDGALVARPGLGSRILSVLIVCFFGGIVAVGVTMSPAVLVVVPAVIYIAARHLARLRVAVVATTDEVIVRNRWRSVRVPADEVVAIDVVARQRTLRTTCPSRSCRRGSGPRRRRSTWGSSGPGGASSRATPWSRPVRGTTPR